MTRIGIWSIQNCYEKVENREEALGDALRLSSPALAVWDGEF
ncbi:hypothetical protein ACNKHR_02255 [Shigella flexneri]